MTVSRLIGAMVSATVNRESDRLPLRRMIGVPSDVQHDVAMFDTLEHLQHLRVGQVLCTLPVDKQYLIT